MLPVCELIKKEKLIVILRGIPPGQLIAVAEAAWTGGVRLLELTFNAAAPELDAGNADAIRILSRHFEGRMYIGAGTVLTPEQAARTADAGGAFVISPNTDEAVIQKTRALGMVSVPGAMTPTEIVNARRAGADFVKVFPADALGCGYFRALAAPLSHIPLLAVGGVKPEDVPGFLKAGAAGFGVSSGIANRKWASEGAYSKITEAAGDFVNAIGAAGSDE